MTPKMICRFGQYTIAINGIDYLPSSLRCEWQKYCIDNNDFFKEETIYLNIASSYTLLNHPSGWTTNTNADEICATYSSLENSIFSIQYNKYQHSLFQLFINQHDTRATMISLQHAIMLALADKCVGLHCVTVLCGDQAIALSAPSGTGKTTLSNLLMKYGDAAVVNGDFALLSVDANEGIIFEPTPFCGSSKINHNTRIPINQIIFLEQSLQNNMKQLNAHKAMKMLLDNVFIPNWDIERTKSIQKNVMHILEYIPIKLFSFAPTAEAVDCFYKGINKTI